MAAVLSYFEVRLSEDVLHDIKTEGKLFKVDLMDVQQSYEDLAGADYTKSALSAAENQHKPPVPRIQLEKLNDRLIRLLVTVYKPSPVETATAESEMQTVAEAGDETSTQTDSSEWMQSADTQTDASPQCHVVAVQTDQSPWLHSEATQTDAGGTTHVGSTQTEWAEWLHCADVQTDSSYWQSTTSAQTDVKQLSSSDTQTQETRIEQTFTDAAVETQATLATQVSEQVQAVVVMSNAQSQMSVETVERHCQATPDVVDSTVQTERRDVHSETQTELSLAWRADREVQAAAAVSDLAVQASVLVNVVDCQTDSSMASMLSCDVQATVDMMCSESQVELAQSDSEAQTEMSMSQQVSSEVQAVVTMTDSQTEHSLSHLDVADVSLPATQNSAVNESFDDFAANMTLSQDTSFHQPVDNSSVLDSSSQTDPVTIIIGDASFLVKKLKNSAGSPSRVTTTGNEIEIELSADAVTEGSGVTDYLAGAVAPPSDEKENELMRQQQAAVLLQQPQQPTVVRSGGVMYRGGVVGGPRFRLPVSHSQQQQQSARVTAGLLVRHPTQQLVITPQQQGVPGPQPVIGGSFSCPFCSLTFIDSPALYEHLSILHTVDQKTKWKQPRGREGKTIVPVKRTGRSPGVASPSEVGPPVLVPLETFSRSGAGDGDHIHGVGTDEQSHTDNGSPQETGLFEDPVEPEVIKKQRGRPAKHSTEEGATPAKRQKVTEDGDEVVPAPKPTHRASGGGDESADERQSAPSGGKRGGRAPRGRRRS